MAGLDALIKKIETIGSLTSEQKTAILSLPMTERSFAPGDNLIVEGNKPTSSILMLEGLAFRYKIAGNGVRQIISFHIAGDMPDLQALFLEVMDHSIAAVHAVRAGFVPHEAISRLLDKHPAVARLLWRESLIDAAMFREWIVNLGRRSALPRTAHLLCELMYRMQAVGLTRDLSCKLPLTQAQLSDALGLSVVHVNRTLKDLRQRGLITIQQGLLIVDDWDGLAEVADFDPSYLHLTHDPLRAAGKTGNRG